MDQNLAKLEFISRMKSPNYKWVTNWFGGRSLFYDFISELDGGIVVEIGTWIGQSSAFIAELIKIWNKPIKFYTVDHFKGTTSDKHEPIIEQMGGNLYDIAVTNFKNTDVYDYINIIVSDSISASKQFEDNSVDLIFIDGAHDTESVTKDIVTWYPKIKDGGLIVGDDADWGSVIKAVDQTIGIENVEIGGSCLWYVRKDDTWTLKI